MKRFVFAAAAVAVAGWAFADLTLQPVNKVYRGKLAYSAATGTFERVAPGEVDGLRAGEIFDSSEGTGYFSSSIPDLWLDWADVATASETFGEFQFDYFLDGSLPVDYVVNWYTDDNGFNDTARDPIDATYTGGLLFTGLPGSPDPGGPCCSGWIFTVDMTGGGFNTTIAGPNKDGIAGADFSYTYQAVDSGNATLLGPSLSNPPGPEGDPDPVTGVESAFDIFSPDLSDPNNNYVGTFWFGPPPAPYAQFYLVLSTGGAPGCPSGLPTDCDTDIVGDTAGSAPNCKVDLTDLSTLLTNFGQTGQTFFEGDVHPAVLGGTPDGDVDLDDLSQMLVDFGNNCQ